MKGNLVLSTELMMQVSHRKEFLKLTFQALALPVIRSNEELLNASNVKCELQKLFTVVNLHHKAKLP